MDNMPQEIDIEARRERNKYIIKYNEKIEAKIDNYVFLFTVFYWVALFVLGWKYGPYKLYYLFSCVLGPSIIMKLIELKMAYKEYLMKKRKVEFRLANLSGYPSTFKYLAYKTIILFLYNGVIQPCVGVVYPALIILAFDLLGLYFDHVVYYPIYWPGFLITSIMTYPLNYLVTKTRNFMIEPKDIEEHMAEYYKKRKQNPQPMVSNTPPKPELKKQEQPKPPEKKAEELFWPQVRRKREL